MLDRTVPDLDPFAVPEDGPAAPTPWISLADLILATLATVVVIGIVVFFAYHHSIKSKLVSAEEKTWLADNRHRDFLPEGMEVITKKDHEDWLAKKNKEVLESDCVAVKKNDWKIAQDALKAQKGIPNKPIVLGLDEVKGFRFDPGSADLTPDFKDKLMGDVFTKIKDVAQNYGIEVLEIVGHTDGLPIGYSRSNLDQLLNGLELESIDRQMISSLKGGSNADLGLMRALSVAFYLNDLTSSSDDPDIRSLVFRVYSAAQLIDPEKDAIGGAPNLNIGERRRIELRFTRKSISLRE
jgi:outer membrane protein OmpA-like peptidoglycan-associated protein